MIWRWSCMRFLIFSDLEECQGRDVSYIRSYIIALWIRHSRYFALSRLIIRTANDLIISQRFENQSYQQNWWSNCNGDSVHKTPVPLKEHRRTKRCPHNIDWLGRVYDLIRKWHIAIDMNNRCKLWILARDVKYVSYFDVECINIWVFICVKSITWYYLIRYTYGIWLWWRFQSTLICNLRAMCALVSVKSLMVCSHGTTTLLWLIIVPSS